MESINYSFFFEILKAGLWEDVSDNDDHVSWGNVDWGEVYRLAVEQSVVGLIAAGIDQLPKGKRPSMKFTLQIIGEALQLEQKNKEMNRYLANLINNLRHNGVYTLLVKGQGVAQCYEKPLLRACGDIDLFLSSENYIKAKDLLIPNASNVEKEGKFSKHLGMTIDGWCVELHGTLRNGLSSKVVRVLDEIQRDTFYNGNVRSWDNNGETIFMLGTENDIAFVFTHFLRHFYKGGIGVRQICDWIRLIWTYRESLDLRILETRIRQMGLMSEWKAFAAMAVDYFGMPATTMPFYDKSSRWSKKAKRIIDFIMMSGNFGHNRDVSYMNKHPYVIRKTISLGRRIGDMFRHARIFPADSFRFFFYIVWNGMRSAMRGE